MTKEELGKEFAWAGGWQTFYAGKDAFEDRRVREPNWEMYDYWTERYNELRRDYAQRETPAQG